MQAGVAHQPLDASVADLHALSENELGVDASVAVGAVRGGVDLTDRLHQMGLFPRAIARRPRAPFVVARRRDVQDPAGHRDGDPVSGEFLDHRVDHFGRTFSRAK